MADAVISLGISIFCSICCFLEACFLYSDQVFYLRIRRFIRVLCKMEYIQRWRMPVPVPFLVINGVIMTSLLLLLLSYVSHLLDSSNTFPSKYFSL